MTKWKNALLERFAPYLAVALLALVLILNSAVIMGVQVALEFPLKSPAEAYETGENWEVLDAYATDRVSGFILWQNRSQWRLVVTERHFHDNRWRVICDTILMEQDFQTEITNGYGRTMVKLHGYADFEQFIWIPNPVYSTLHVPGDFLLWNGGLLILEIAVFIIIRKLKGT